MDRRQFLNFVALSSAGLVTGSKFLNATELRATDEQQICNGAGIQTFAYYQGLGPNERRSPNRNDGTTYKMPCITQSDLDAEEDRVYEFWHGHGATTHKFTITSEQFRRIKAGELIELYTDLVDGHRHALRVALNETCSYPSASL